MPAHRTLALAAALATVSAAPAHAADAAPAEPNVSYALDVRGGLYTIDRGSGAATLVSELPDGGAGLAIDAKGSMYTISGQNLLRIDPATGATTAIGHVGPSGYGLTFDASGTLFAGFNTPNALVRIDPTTAEVTVIGKPAFGEHESFSGLAVDPTTGAMYAMTLRVPTLTAVLYRVDPTDAAVTRIGETKAQLSHTVLHFDEAGMLFGASTALKKLYTIDVETGLETEVGPTAAGAGATAIVTYGAASYVKR